MASEAKAPPPSHVAQDVPAAKAPPPAHVAQDASPPAEPKPTVAHVAQDGTPKPPRKPHADTPAAGAVAKAAAEALMAAPDGTTTPRPPGSGSPRATAAMVAAARGIRTKERDEHAGDALRAAAAEVEAAAGEKAAPALRASAEEVADAARGRADTAMKDVAVAQQAEAKSVLRRAAAEADAPAEKAIEVLAAKAKAVEPALERAKPPLRIDDDDVAPSRRRRCDWKGMDIKFDLLLDQLEDACQISKHALAILPTEEEKKEIDAELVRRSYDEMLDRVRLAHDRATDILKAAGPPKPKPPPPPPPPPYVPGAPFVPFCGEGNVLGGEW